MIMWEFINNHLSWLMWGTAAFNLYSAVRSHLDSKRLKSTDNELRQECTRFRMMCNVINRMASRSQVQEINRELEAVNLLIDSPKPKIPELKLVKTEKESHAK